MVANLSTQRWKSCWQLTYPQLSKRSWLEIPFFLKSVDGSCDVLLVHMMLWSNLCKLLANRKYITNASFSMTMLDLPKGTEGLRNHGFLSQILASKKTTGQPPSYGVTSSPRSPGSVENHVGQNETAHENHENQGFHHLTCRNVVSHWILSSHPSKGRDFNISLRVAGCFDPVKKPWNFVAPRRPAPTRAFEVATKRAGWTWFFLLILILA